MFPDDLWVVTQSLSCDGGITFLAKSVFFGPTSQGEVEIEPISGFSPSNWSSEGIDMKNRKRVLKNDFINKQTIRV